MSRSFQRDIGWRAGNFRVSARAESEERARRKGFSGSHTAWSVIDVSGNQLATYWNAVLLIDEVSERSLVIRWSGLTVL